MATPLVTGISPAEGSPGTIVKIRGDNLGKNGKDLLGVFICKVNCTYTAEWHSTYIQCRTGMGLGVGNIIVVTKSGGVGSSTVTFKGIMPRVGLLTESAVWVDESKLFEEKPTSSGIPTSRSMSPPMLSVDPLGVAQEETGNLLPADKIEEMYPKCSGNTLTENFHPARFLLERHLDTSFTALQSGYIHLESHDTRSSSAGPSSFIRKNLGTILESLETLAAVKTTMNENESEAHVANICNEMEEILQNCNSVANNMFQGILTRKDEADIKRNAVNVLQRFKFLFSLQKNIDRKIQQGEYEIVISDYNRAKTFMQNTEVKCFQKVLKDVDARMATFMIQLRSKLFEFPSTFEDRKRMIRYLNDLDYAGDPAWECIEKMHSWLMEKCLNCKEDHQRLESSTKLMSPPSSCTDVHVSRSDSRVDQFSSLPGHTRSASDGGKAGAVLQQISKKKANSRAGSVQGSLPEISGAAMPEITPGRVLFIFKLTELMSSNLPDFWKLGQAYLLGQFRKKVSQSASEDEIMKRENKFSGMVKSVLKLFDGLIRAVVQPESLTSLNETNKLNYGGWNSSQHSLVSWLPECARIVRSCLGSFKALTIPSELLASLRKLSTDLCSIAVHEVLQTTIADTKTIHSKEEWELDYDSENNCISTLPGLFQKIFTDALHFVKEFMAEARIESKQDQSLKLKEQVSESLKIMVKSFIDALLVVLGDHLQQDVNKADSVIPMIASTSSTLSTAISLEERLLILLSNTSYLRNMLLPILGTRCKDFGYMDLENLPEMFADDIAKLESEVLSTYIEIKGEPLVGSIEQGMSLGEYRWDEDIPIIGVRAYVREVIMSLVVIHDQVSAISLSYVPVVFAKLGNILSEEIKRIFECQEFSRTGTIQAHLELSVFESSLSHYLSETAKETFVGARNVLPQLKNESSKVVEDLVEKFNKEMAYQLSCFTLIEPTPEEPSAEIIHEPPVDMIVESNPFLLDEDNDYENRNVSLKDTPSKKLEEKAKENREEKQPSSSPIEIQPTKTTTNVPVAQKLKEETNIASPTKKLAPNPPKSNLTGVSPPKGKSLAPLPPKSKSKAPEPPLSMTPPKSKSKAPSPPRVRSVPSEKAKPVTPKSSLSTKESSNPFLDSDEEEEVKNTNPFL